MRIKKPSPAVLSTLASVVLAAACTILAQDASQTLITHVHVFDGVSEVRIENANVLAE